MLWYRVDLAFVETVKFYAGEVGWIRFDIVLIVEFLPAYMTGERTVQVVVRSSQGRRIGWIRSSDPCKVQKLLSCRFCYMGSCVVVQQINSILFSFEFLCNPIQLLTVEISSDAVAIGKNFPMNNLFDSPPHTARPSYGVDQS